MDDPAKREFSYSLVFPTKFSYSYLMIKTYAVAYKDHDSLYLFIIKGNDLLDAINNTANEDGYVFGCDYAEQFNSDASKVLDWMKEFEDCSSGLMITWEEVV